MRYVNLTVLSDNRIKYDTPVLGVAGEINATTLTADVSSWMQIVEAGSVYSIVLKRPDNKTFPILSGAVPTNGKLSVVLDALASQSSGTAEITVQAEKENYVVKSASCNDFIFEISLVPGNPPAAAVPLWIEQVTAESYKLRKQMISASDTLGQIDDRVEEVTVLKQEAQTAAQEAYSWAEVAKSNKLVFKGSYSPSEPYVELNVVSHVGSSYICVRDTIGHDPADTVYWFKLAEKGEQGVQGEQGKSSYQVWLDAGSTGTVDDYILSLRGGTGSTGKSAYEIAVEVDGFTGSAAQWLQSLIGQKGDNGQGVPTGGSSNQILRKISETDFNTEWHELSKSDVGLSNVPNTDTTTTSNINDSTNRRFVTDSQKTVLQNTSGVNTGDQDLSGLVTKTTTVNSKPLSSNVSLSQDDVGDGSIYKQFSASEKTKLSGIASGATVGADWSTNVLNKPTLGTSSSKDSPSSGNATSAQVVMGNDTRLSDSRNPLAHVHSESDITGLSSSLSGLVPTSRTVNSKALSSNISLTQDDVGDGTTYKQFSSTEKTKLSGISSGATVGADWSTNVLNKPSLGTSSSKDVAPTGDASSTQVVLGNDSRLTDSRTPKTHNHTESEITGLSSDLSSKLTANTAITGATKTKITYDSKGLVTSGADATTADIADSLNRRYVTDSQLSSLSSLSGLSGVNTGDETVSTIKSKLGITTLSGDNTGDETATSIKSKLGITTLSGANTGDQDLSAYEPKLPATPAYPETKFLNGNKEWSEVALGSGGYASNIYMTAQTSTIVGTYKQFSPTSDVAESEVSAIANNNEVLISAYLFEYPIGVSNIDAGIWITSLYSKTSVSGTARFKVVTFKRSSAGVETVLFTAYSPFLTNTSYQINRYEANQPSITVDPTDRIGGKIYACSSTVGNVTLSFVVGDGNSSYTNTPLALRHSQLRGKNDEESYQHISLTEKNNFTTAYTNTHSHTNKTALDNVSGVNTGDQDLSGLVPNTRTINSKALSSNISLTQDDITDGTTNKQFSQTEKTKLSGIASGATVGADWNVNVSNKPTLGTASTKDYPSSGNASSTQVVLGNDTRLTDSRTPTTHNHTESEITNLTSDLASKVTANAGITGATKTKITYDAKGLVTSGSDATTADVSDSTNRRYVTDSQLTVIGNTSGANTGDETVSTIKTKLGAATASVDGYATAAQITKLDGISSGATVGADWNTNVSNKPTLGTASTKDFPSSGNASTTQVVLGSDTRLADSRSPTAHNHTESEITGLTTDLGNKVTANAGITAATKTKITYDAKGLVTSGSDATTADIADSTDKRYVTDAQISKLNGIQAGADANVNADWNSSSGDSQILNKPTLGSLAAKSSVNEDDLSFSDLSQGNASTERHGLLPKLSGSTTSFLRADGNWATPPSGTGTGSYEMTKITITTDAVISDEQFVICNCSSGSFNVTLPDAASATKPVYVKKIDSSKNTATVVGTIDGETNYILEVEGEFVQVAPDGTSWQIIAE